ncbi:MAG TPA: HAD hydrolase family protein [Egibacteraceae bacterium]|nr:HAD hydrolase family protein [Egibacteraceae bacterium]
MSTDELGQRLAALPRVRAIYTDLDGTLLGPRGSLLHGPDGRPSARAAEALVAAAAAGVEVIPVSGRQRKQLENDARLMGLDDCVAEAGVVIVRDGVRHYEWGDLPRGLAGNPHDTMTEAGAVAVLLRAFPDDLRHYEPWHLDREGSHLFHGRVDVAAADRLLDEHGCSWASLIDNGDTGGWPGRSVRAYHLVPRGIDKARAVADDIQARGLRREETLGVGDSLADLAMAASVGTFVIVANGHGEAGDGVVRVDEAMGHGFAAAVEAALSARR